MASRCFEQVAGAILLLVFLLAGCDWTQQQTAKHYPFSYSGWIMGTAFNIKAPKLAEGVDGEQLKIDIMSVLLDVDGKMSTYKQDSELSRLNALTASNEISVSESLFKVLSEAQRVSRLSDGAFDVTVGKLVNLWGFGSDKDVSEPPDQQLIEQVLQTIGYDQFLLDSKKLSIKNLNAEVYIDLSALAKGYAVDRVSALLEAKQIENFLVEIGGELKLKGRNSNNEAWRIAIEKPTADGRAIQVIIEVTDIAIASSGGYRNFFEQNGKRYSHMIDPRTGWPVTHKLLSVTVLSDSAMTADALATAFMVLGYERGLVLAEQQKIPVLFYVKGDNALIEHSSLAYQNFLKAKP